MRKKVFGESNSRYKSKQEALDAGAIHEGVKREEEKSSEAFSKIWDAIEKSNGLQNIKDSAFEEIDQNDIAKVLIAQGPTGMDMLIRGLKNLNNLSAETALRIEKNGHLLYSDEDWRERTQEIIWKHRDNFSELPIKFEKLENVPAEQEGGQEQYKEAA